ncbi:MAG: hypothetical protein GSR77_03420 [Desulfurococcales archaeon]|nr:hypothetical protein [Desulfurococcales archaeon]
MCRALIRSPTYEIEICSNCILNLISKPPKTPFYMLSLDAEYGILGEKLAGIFLGPFNIEGDCKEKILSLAETYRKRIILEQLHDLYTRIGKITMLAQIDPYYIPLSRSILLGKNHYCNVIENYYEGDPAGLRKEYSRLAGILGVLGDGSINLAVLEELYKKLSNRLKEFLSSTSIRIPGRLLWFPLDGECKSNIIDPGDLISLPEGRLSLLAYRPEKLLSEYLGGTWRCEQATFLASSLKCTRSNDKKTVIAKIYEKMQVKWIPAYIASPAPVRYLVSSRARLSNEYYWLRRLRDTIHTPRILLVSASHSNRIMIREYLEGVPVLSSRYSKQWEEAGRSLAEIHSAGYALGDPNPGNFIYREGDIALIDAEQARRYSLEAGAWDLVVFVVYSIVFGADKNLVRTAIEGYASVDPGGFQRIKELLLSGKGWGGVRFLPIYYNTAKKIIGEVS